MQKAQAQRSGGASSVWFASVTLTALGMAGCGGGGGPVIAWTDGGPPGDARMEGAAPKRDSGADGAADAAADAADARAEANPPPVPLPDLVVTAVSTAPAAPSAGQEVLFSATIENRGTVATPSDVPHGVRFSVDGAPMSWSGDYRGPLAAGASVVVTANGTSWSSVTWTAAAGAHTLEAWVDDVDRMMESDESNNELSKSISVAAAPSPGPTPSPGPGKARFFSARSPWNTPIPANPSIDPKSEQYLSYARAVKGPGDPLQLNRGDWTVNVSFAPKGGPRGYAINPDRWRMDGVPLTADASGTSDSDGHLVIVDLERGLIWNFFRAHRVGDHFDCGAPGVFRIDGPGWWDPSGGTVGGPWTGRSSNASLLAGLIFPEDLEAGEIPHALAISMDLGAMGNFPVLPAKTTDGTVAGGIPNGSRLQLDPSLNLDTLGLEREAKVIARAWQVYGAFIVERSSGIALYFRSTQNMGGANPYAAMRFGGLTGTLLRHMRLISPAASYEYDYPSRYSPPQPYR